MEQVIIEKKTQRTIKSNVGYLTFVISCLLSHSSTIFGLPIVAFNKRTGPVCAIRNVGLKKGHGIKIPWWKDNLMLI